MDAAGVSSGRGINAVTPWILTDAIIADFTGRNGEGEGDFLVSWNRGGLTPGGCAAGVPLVSYFLPPRHRPHPRRSSQCDCNIV